jgi:DNA repair protein RecO (recombination protein O)
MLLFICDVLTQVIKEEEKNNDLFVFIETSLMWLDNQENFSNYHLIFLVEITKYLGFYPDLETINNNYFECIEGKFIVSNTNTTLNLTESNLLKTLFLLKFNESKNIFNQQERQVLLKIILQYFKTHIQGFKEPKSLEILKEIFM